MAVVGPIIASVVGAIATSALSSKPSAPQISIPTPPTVPTMPTPNSTAVQQAQQLSIAQQLQTQGRASTILTQQSGNASGGAKLGA